MKDNNDNKNKIRKKKLGSSDTAKPDKNTSKPSKSNKFKYLRVFSILFLGLIVAGSAIATGVTFAALKDVEEVTKASLDKKTNARSIVYNADGLKMYETPSTVKKTAVPIDKMPKDMKNAIVSIEDERFYKHHGVDIMGLARAAVINIFTSRAPGGSTLNMQVSKMLLTNTEVSIARKLKDIYYAHEIDKVLTKDQVLELYLNNLPLGRGAAGVQAGAKIYFNKDISELNLAECAMLAGITQNPSKYTVYTTAKLESSDTKESLENKLIFYQNTEDDKIDDPTKEELQMVEKLESWGLIPNDYYKELQHGTMVVRKATLNENAVNRQRTVLMKMHELKYITDAEYEKAKSTQINISIPKPEDRVSSYVESLVYKSVVNELVSQGHTEEEARSLYFNGGLKINTSIDPNVQGILESEFSKSSNFPGNIVDSKGIPQPQAAMVIMDHSTGQIKGLLGGRNVKGQMTLNRVTVPRQPGSTIKPLAVYTPAIDSGMTQADVKSDVRGGYKFAANTKWNPRTTTAGSGTMTLRKGLAQSSNIIAVKVAEDLGDTADKALGTMMDYLNNFGINNLTKEDRTFSALTLGGMTHGIKPLDMAAAYGSLANGGVYIEPTIVTSIQSADGQVLSKKAPKQHKVVDSQVSYIMTDMMTGAIKSYGTAKRAKLNSDMPVAGKTGTTNDDKEAWFVGYTPYYVGATIIADDYGSFPGGIRSVSGGSSTSAQLWANVMNRVHAKLSVKDFKKPSGIQTARIDLASGGVASYEGSSTDVAAFKEGTIPSRGHHTVSDEDATEEKPKHESEEKTDEGNDKEQNPPSNEHEGSGTSKPDNGNNNNNNGGNHNNGNNNGNGTGNGSGTGNGTGNGTGTGNDHNNGGGNTGNDNNTGTTPTPQSDPLKNNTNKNTTKPTPGTTGTGTTTGSHTGTAVHAAAAHSGTAAKAGATAKQ